MSFTVEYLEYSLLVFVRIISIFYAAPLFGNRAVINKVKIGLAFFLTLIIMNVVDYTAVSYEGLLGYSIIVVQEAITGLIIGIASGFCMYIVNYAGSFIDMEMGLSMAMEFDPNSNMQSTITANFLSHLFIAMFLVSDMHHFVINAMVDSYTLVPIGQGNIAGGSLYQVMVKFITDYFVIGLRISLPIFACMFVINIVLGVLAKVAPQMNMFIVGMQLKLFVGFFVLFMVMGMISGISDFIFGEMKELTNMFMKILAP